MLETFHGPSSFLGSLDVGGLEMLSDLVDKRRTLVGHAFVVEAEIEEGTELEQFTDRLADSIKYMDHVGRVVAYHVTTLLDGIAKERA